VLFWFSFGTQKRTYPAENDFIKATQPIPYSNTLCTGSKSSKTVLLVIINKPVIVFFALE